MSYPTGASPDRGQPAAGPILPGPDKLPATSQEHREEILPQASFPACSTMVLPPILMRALQCLKSVIHVPCKDSLSKVWHKPLKRPLCDVVFGPLTILVALLWTHSFVNAPLKNVAPSPGHSAPDIVRPAQSTVRLLTFLDLDTVLLFVQIQIALVFGGFVFVLFSNSCIILLSFVELVVYSNPRFHFP